MEKAQFDKIQSIDGWFGIPEMNALYPFVVTLSKDSMMVEIGTFNGKSTLFWRFSNPNIKIITIDICSDMGIGTQENQINSGKKIPEQIDGRVLSEGNIFQIRGDSHEIVKGFNMPIDMLFIDSEHSYTDTIENLNEWGGFVKKDHFILCHDYDIGTFPGVVKAVNEYVELKLATLVFSGSGVAVLKV